MERTRICVVLLMKWRKQWLSDMSGNQRELLTSIKNKICDAHNDSVPIQGNVIYSEGEREIYRDHQAKTFVQ